MEDTNPNFNQLTVEQNQPNTPGPESKKPNFPWGIIALIIVVLVAIAIYFFYGQKLNDYSFLNQGESNKISNKMDIFARLDTSSSGGGCYPFHPIDLYIKNDNGDETIIYNDLELCDPSGSPIKDGLLGEEGLLQTRPFYINDIEVGKIILVGGGDAGSRLSRSFYVAYKNPEEIIETSTGWMEGDGPSASISYRGEKNFIDVKPDQYTWGNCSETNINILFDGSIVWTLDDSSKDLVCRNDLANYLGEKGESATNVSRERIDYRVGFFDIKPTNEDFTNISMRWRNLEISFDLSNPKDTFEVVEIATTSLLAEVNEKDYKFYVFARLDTESTRNECYPFYPIDLSLKDIYGNETLIYDDLELCARGGGFSFVDGQLSNESGTTLRSLPFYIDDVEVGKVISFPDYDRDRGASLSKSFYLTYKNPEEIMETSTGWMEDGPIASISYRGEKKFIKVEPKQYTLGPCSEKDINVLFNGSVVLTLDDSGKDFVCKNDPNYLRQNEERIYYHAGFYNMKPTNEDFTDISMRWGNLEISFDLSNPKYTFELHERNFGYKIESNHADYGDQRLVFTDENGKSTTLIESIHGGTSFLWASIFSGTKNDETGEVNLYIILLRDGTETFPPFDIYKYNSSKNEITKLDNRLYESHRVSPDGSKVAYVKGYLNTSKLNWNSELDGNLYVLDLDRDIELSVATVDTEKESLLKGCGLGCYGQINWLGNKKIQYSVYSIPPIEEQKAMGDQRLQFLETRTANLSF